MIQRHDDHNEPAQDINSIDPVLSHRLKNVGFRHVVKLIFFCLFGMPLCCIGKGIPGEFKSIAVGIAVVGGENSIQRHFG